MKDGLHKDITLSELKELERKDATVLQKVIKRIKSFIPIFIGLLHLLEYNYIVNAKNYVSTNVYNVFIGFFVIVLFVWFIVAFFNSEAYDKLAYKSWFYAVIFGLLMVYDYLTLKTATLKLPYFPWVDNIFNSMIDDRVKLADCVKNSLCLLFNGYFKGIVVGLICGIGAGWSKKIYYWVYPVAKVLGAIPSTTYMPIVVMVASSLFTGSAFIIALGVWFPVTMTSMTGVASVRTHFYEVAQTLGTSKRGILFRVVIPATLPSIFGGLTQGMSVACLTLVVAEMMGVESGLGWYINWQKGWAEFAKMYGAIILICITFIITNAILNLIKKRVLRWQKEGV